MKRHHSFLLAALVLGAPWAQAQADCKTDRKLRTAGMQVFEAKCAICHSVDKRQGHTFGPNLSGVLGRPVGKAAGFEFSKVFGSVDKAWDAKALDGFLKEPTVVYPGTAMAFAGLESEQDRSAVVCFLSAQANGKK